ncbi:MAG: hypothetical protein AB7G37_20010 [Solirubrobacteraceae bacterium]
MTETPEVPTVPSLPAQDAAPQTPPPPTPTSPEETVVQIVPASGEVEMILFNVVGIGKFRLPVLGHKHTPYGITSAFAVFKSIDQTNRAAVLSAWGHVTQALANLYPEAVMVIARLDEEDMARVLEAWVEQSRGFVPKAP